MKKIFENNLKKVVELITKKKYWRQSALLITLFSIEVLSIYK